MSNNFTQNQDIWIFNLVELHIYSVEDLIKDWLTVKHMLSGLIHLL